MALLNRDGQPFNLRFNRARRAERDISEMLGLVKGLLADGHVSGEETLLLHDWLDSHPDAVEAWPANMLADRLARIMSDGHIDEEERTDLAELLNQLVGGEAGVIDDEQAASELPIDRPPPEVSFPDSVFVFTGKFAFGPRKDCERQVESLGGIPERRITRRSNYLVIGTFGSRDWIQTSYGRKIEKAVKYREKGVPLTIIAENHWADSIP